jgi:RHS repeat-associated protein
MEGIGTAKVTDNGYKYNGKELNEDLGLNLSDYGARWYDAALGRWWSVDPMGEAQVNFSPYTYVYNNPMIFIDPTGMIGEGADGITDDQWLISSRPNNTGKSADDFRKENRAAETERKRSGGDIEDGIEYVTDSETGESVAIGSTGIKNVDIIYHGIIKRGKDGKIIEINFSTFGIKVVLVEFRTVPGYGGLSRGPGCIISHNIATGLFNPTEDPFTFAAGGAIRSVAKLSVWGGEVVAAQAGEKYLYHYTSETAAQNITKTGLKTGGDGFLYLTNKSSLSPLQAQIELALPASRALPTSILRIDVSGLSPSLIRRVSGNLPGYGAGGGTEFLFNQNIPANLIKIIK